MKKSIIRKSISRKLSTAQYETLDVFVEIEEEVEWDSIKERMEKTDKINKVLVMDFIRTLKLSLNDLGLKKKLASLTGPSNSETVKKKAKSKNNDYDSL